MLHSENQYFLEQLGVDWYHNFRSDTSNVPSGYNKLPHISASDPSNLLSADAITSLVQSAPAGSYWYVGGEPNNPAGYVSPAAFVEVFRHYYTNIKAADPTARVTGPSILNWDFTCIGCQGFQSGESWLTQFISAYESAYNGEKPPVDVWTIDTYPIDWTNTPNNDPNQLAFYPPKAMFMPHWQIVTEQLKSMREYLDNNGYSNTPIWITEIAVHVGYDGWQFDSPLDPVGSYHWDKMSDFLNSVLDWLEANAAGHNIERWFFFKSWKDIVNVGNDGYMGIIFFDGPEVGASLNCLGEAYRARALGLSPVKCDAAGNTVPAN